MNENESTFADGFKEVFATLPPVIRAYLAEQKYTAVVKQLTQKYGLRIDQAGGRDQPRRIGVPGGVGEHVREDGRELLGAPPACK